MRNEELRIAGEPIGQQILDAAGKSSERDPTSEFLIIVIATNIPLQSGNSNASLDGGH